MIREGIVEGSIVRVWAVDPPELAIACSPIEAGEVLVKWTTGRGATEFAFPASKVEWVRDPW